MFDHPGGLGAGAGLWKESLKSQAKEWSNLRRKTLQEHLVFQRPDMAMSPEARSSSEGILAPVALRLFQDQIREQGPEERVQSLKEVQGSFS